MPYTAFVEFATAKYTNTIYRFFTTNSSLGPRTPLKLNVLNVWDPAKQMKFE